MARLHIAEQIGIEGFSKIVALKRVHPHLAESDDLRRMFSTEAKLAARLDHPNIATVYELGEVDGTYFISLEYLPGEDLAAILKQAGRRALLPIEIALWIAENAAAALHYAHELLDAQGRPVGMVHRDVTPSNIMVTYHGVTKLLDFGIAKARTSGIATREGIFKGKLAYSAPEQLSGEPIDRRADIFCLGIVLWECLTGRRLFHAQSDAERVDAVRSREIVPPSKLRPDVPPELDAVVMRMLSRERAARYPSALDVQQVLGSTLSWQRERVTPEAAAAWLERTFGTERAAVKRAIAQGHAVEAMLQELARMQAVETAQEDSGATPVSPAQRSSARPLPRKAWSTDVVSTRPSPSSSSDHGMLTVSAPDVILSRSSGPPAAVRTQDALPLVEPDASSRYALVEPRGRPWAALAAGVALAVGAVVGVTVVIMERDAPVAAAVAASGTLRISTDPPGALVFVDGAPTGRTTPCELARLPVGRALRVRVEQAGAVPIEREVMLADATPVQLALPLAIAVGEVTLRQVPAGARVFVDERAVDAARPFELAVGTHAFRVESADDVLWTAQIEVRPGRQEIQAR